MQYQTYYGLSIEKIQQKHDKGGNGKPKYYYLKKEAALVEE